MKKNITAIVGEDTRFSDFVRHVEVESMQLNVSTPNDTTIRIAVMFKFADYICGVDTIYGEADYSPTIFSGKKLRYPLNKFEFNTISGSPFYAFVVTDGEKNAEFNTAIGGRTIKIVLDGSEEAFRDIYDTAKEISENYRDNIIRLCEI